MSDQPRNDTPAQDTETAPAQSQTDDVVTDSKAGGESSSSGGAPPAGAGEEAAAEPTVEERLAQLEADKAQLAKEKQENWDRFLRATADLENFRKRSRRDLDDARIEARSKVLREMLPVIDNLDRALVHAESTEGGAQSGGIVEGVQLVMRQFAQALERCDVRPVEAVGKPFDPNMHEAISQMETAEHPPGSVVQSLQKGYTIGERLLRPALVVVAKAPSEPAPGASGPDGKAATDGGEESDSSGA